MSRQISDFCKACGGRCCKHLDFTIKLGGLKKELLKAHFGAEINELKIRIHHDCPHLAEDGLCDLWRADPEEDLRPAVCQNTLCGRAKLRRLVFDAYEDGGDKDS